MTAPGSGPGSERERGSGPSARAIRQHAETAGLLGVGIVARVELGIVREDADAYDRWSHAPAPRPRERPKLAEGTIEPKPRPTPESAPQSAPGRRPSAVRSAYTPIERPAGDLAPERAQALLDEVRARYERDAPHQHFHTSFNNIVFGEGDPCARLVFVGEAPGENEDQTGRPFVGRAGQLLDKMIVAMGLARDRVYIANVLKTRPPGNATPTSEEAELCAPYLLDQIRVVAPSVIVTLGLPASRLLLGTSGSMRDLRGRFHPFPPEASSLGLAPVFGAAGDLPEIVVMPTYHPAYLLRSYTPENRKKVWSDLKQVMDRLGLGAA